MINSEETQAGAHAALDAMRIIESVADSEAPNWSPEKQFSSEAAAISAAVIAAGDVSQRAKGVILALAEYIYRSNAGGIPNLAMWKPGAMLTDEEIAEYRRDVQQSYEH
jgi:hypothetical protein